MLKTNIYMLWAKIYKNNSKYMWIQSCDNKSLAEFMILIDYLSYKLIHAKIL